MRFRNGYSAARKTYTQFRKEYYWYKKKTAGFQVVYSGMFVVTHAIIVYFKDGRKGIYNRNTHIFKFIKEDSDVLKYAL